MPTTAYKSSAPLNVRHNRARLEATPTSSVRDGSLGPFSPTPISCILMNGGCSKLSSLWGFVCFVAPCKSLNGYQYNVEVSSGISYCSYVRNMEPRYCVLRPHRSFCPVNMLVDPRLEHPPPASGSKPFYLAPFICSRHARDACALLGFQVWASSCFIFYVMCT